MARRNVGQGGLDDYPTPPWATAALLEHVIRVGKGDHVHEPAANRGHMVRVLERYADRVSAYDIHDYGCGYPTRDYVAAPAIACDWTITNPPFRLAESFILKALPVSEKGVAMLCRTAFAESERRYEGLFKDNPPTKIGQFTQRVSMSQGKLDPTVSSATCYAWFVWETAMRGQPCEFMWIPPCKWQMEVLLGEREDGGLL